MRFALMIEPQQGLSYDDQLAIARRAEATGFEAFFRSDHYPSFPGPAGQPDDRRLGRPRRPRPRDRPDRARRARLAGHVPPPRQLRQGRHDGRRDERRPDRGRPRRRLERRGARPARAAVPADRASAPTCSRRARRSSTGCGASPTAGRSRGEHVQIRDAQFHPKPVDVPGRPTPPNGASRPRILIGGGGTPRSMRIAARYADEFNLSSSSPDGRPDEVRGSSTRRARRSAATRRRSPARRCPACSSGATADEVRRRQRRSAAGLRQRRRGRGLVRRAARALGLRDAGRGRAQVDRFADAGTERIMLQDFLPWDLDMVDVMASSARSVGSADARIARSRSRDRCRPHGSPRRVTRRPRRPPRSAGRRAGSGRGSCRGRGRGARSGAGAASPCRAAPRPAPAAPAPRRRAAGRPASGRRGSTGSASRGDDRRRPDAEDRAPRRAPGAPARAAPARPSRSARIRTRPVDASVAGRWPWRNVSRSRYADGSHDASSTLRTSSRPAGRSAPDAMTSRSSARRRGAPAIRLGAGLVARPGREQRRDARRRRAAGPTDAPPTAAAATIGDR